MHDKYTIFSHKTGHMSLAGTEDVTNNGYKAPERQWVFCLELRKKALHAFHNFINKTQK